jgi:hypothetical protein
MVHIGKITAYKQVIPQHVAENRLKGKTKAKRNMIRLKPVAYFQKGKIGLMDMLKKMILFRAANIRIPGKRQMGV